MSRTKGPLTSQIDLSVVKLFGYPSGTEGEVERWVGSLAGGGGLKRVVVKLMGPTQKYRDQARDQKMRLVRELGLQRVTARDYWDVEEFWEW